MAVAPLARSPRTLGAPINLPLEYEAAWMDWYDNKDNGPVLTRNAEGRLVLKAGAKSLITYAPFIEIVVKDGELYGKCVIHSCDSPASKEGVRLTFSSKVHMTNLIDHLFQVHDSALLTAPDHKLRADAIAAKAAADPRKLGRRRGRWRGGSVGLFHANGPFSHHRAAEARTLL